jgi:hypothetical protein
VRRRPIISLAVLLALVGAPGALAARPAQAGPEYGIIVSTMASAFQATQPVFTCAGPDLVTALTGALGGPDAVQKLGLELVAQAVGTSKKPWPRNHRSFAYQGRRWVPDFVRGGTLYLVSTSQPPDPTEVHDLRAIARARGGQLVVVTRKNAAIAPSLAKAASRSWSEGAGRIRILRCI